MKKRVYTGIQPSGKLHIGNYFGTIKRMVDYQKGNDLFLMIASLHSLTTLQDKESMSHMILEAAMDMLALGINPNKSYFWVQSDVPEVAELAWILSCVTPMGMMERATSYKDKLAKGIQPSAGLFNYPILQTADVLIVQGEIVPVGRDQKQHLEMMRDIAIKFNNQFGYVFAIPEPDISEDVAVIPGTDGQKMSKSYNNTIPIFEDQGEWKKSVMGIVTDSKGIDEAKEPVGNTIFELYKLFANNGEVKEMADRFRKGGLGYGEAKKMLLEKIMSTFGEMSKKRAELAKDPEKVETILKEGAEKVRAISLKTLEAVRVATGLRY